MHETQHAALKYNPVIYSGAEWKNRRKASDRLKFKWSTLKRERLMLLWKPIKTEQQKISSGNNDIWYIHNIPEEIAIVQ